MELKRAISIDQLQRMKFKTMKFEGEWADSIGEVVEMSGSWIVYGSSGHGKTAFTIQLAKYLTKFGKVAYNTIEEGARYTFQMAMGRHEFSKIEKRRLQVLSEDMKHLEERLSRQKSPNIIIIDSLQFTGIVRKEYNALIKRYPNKTFIWISHADGKKPLGSLAVYVEYNSDVKIRIEGFKAIIKSRYGGSEDFTIVESKSAEYWNEII